MSRFSIIFSSDDIKSGSLSLISTHYLTLFYWPLLKWVMDFLLLQLISQLNLLQLIVSPLISHHLISADIRWAYCNSFRAMLTLITSPLTDFMSFHGLSHLIPFHPVKSQHIFPVGTVIWTHLSFISSSWFRYLIRASHEIVHLIFLLFQPCSRAPQWWEWGREGKELPFTFPIQI